MIADFQKNLVIFGYSALTRTTVQQGTAHTFPTFSQGSNEVGWQRSASKSNAYQAFGELHQTCKDVFSNYFDYDVPSIFEGHEQPGQVLINVGGTHKSILNSVDTHEDSGGNVIFSYIFFGDAFGNEEFRKSRNAASTVYESNGTSAQEVHSTDATSLFVTADSGLAGLCTDPHLSQQIYRVV